VLLAALIYAGRRSRATRPSTVHRPPTVQAWQSTGPAAPAGPSVPVPVGGAVATAPVEEIAAAPTEPEPDIDELIARLNRMQTELFKKQPKQDVEQSADEESTEVPRETE
jgi:hypothetical protein